MSIRNLLQETIEILDRHGLSLDDIRFIHTTYGDFVPSMGGRKFLNVDYDASYGSVHIDLNLKLVGDDWWLERHEYDGSEWWEFKKLPVFGKKVSRFVTPVSDY